MTDLVSNSAPVKRKRIKPSLTTALVLGFGALIVIGMGTVQAIAMWSAQKNTRELLAGNARFAVVSLVRVARGRGILPPETPGEGAGSGPFMENAKSRYQSFWGAG